MLPVLEKVEANINHSFYVNHLKVEHFPSPLHFHPEIEILFVLQGKGTRFIGDSVKRYSPGDLIMIGSGTPHVWYSDRSPGSEQDNISEAIYIMFRVEIFGKAFWDLPESKSITKVIANARRGIKLEGSKRTEASKIMMDITKATGFDRVRLLFDILGCFATSKEHEFLSSPVLQNTINLSDSERLNRIYEFTINNSGKDISLNDIATIANLSTPAFCRYFKKRLNKTFVQFLNEVRVGNACRMLIEEEYPVSDICFMCGFNNISYFIKQFKNITGHTPLNYRKQFI